MATTPVDVKKVPANRSANLPDAWRSLRDDMNRLFDRFGFGLEWPSLAPVFDVQFPVALSGRAPAADLNEDDRSYTLNGRAARAE